MQGIVINMEEVKLQTLVQFRYDFIVYFCL